MPRPYVARRDRRSRTGGGVKLSRPDNPSWPRQLGRRAGAGRPATGSCWNGLERWTNLDCRGIRVRVGTGRCRFSREIARVRIGQDAFKAVPTAQGDVDVPDPPLTTIADLLLQRIREDDYPSATQMQLLESIIPQSMVNDYLEVLLEKIQADTWPSIPMIQRIIRVAGSASASPSATAA